MSMTYNDQVSAGSGRLLSDLGVSSLVRAPRRPTPQGPLRGGGPVRMAERVGTTCVALINGRILRLITKKKKEEEGEAREGGGREEN